MTGQTNTAMNKKCKVDASEKSVRSDSPEVGGAADDDFQVEDWLTKELGRRPTMEERFERIRLAARRMGIPEPEPEPELTDEELTRIAESARLLKTIPRRKVKKDSVELLREMRGGCE